MTEGQHPPLVANDPPECEGCGDLGDLDNAGYCRMCRPCEVCGETDGHDPDCQDYEAPENDDCETEAEWLDRRLGW